MALNFDAKLTLDVSEFLASIKKAEAAVDGLKKKLATPNSLGGATGLPTGVKERQMASQGQASEKMADDVVRNSARARYALYDIAAAYQQVERIAINALKAIIGTAAEYERSFVNVARTTEFVSVKLGESARAMKYSLTELATQIPVSFSGITEIATIGNQLGIAQGKLVSFTKAVAQFSSITGVGIENAALSFGRIGELLASAGEEIDYNQLASSIAYAGVKAVATETQILSVTKEIATTAKMAKFSASEVVGLATALSSLGIAPEAARGSIIRTFALINQAVGEGGSKLQGYASVAGVSAKEFANSWTKNGQVAFDTFLSGLQRLSDSGQNLDTVLRNLGIHNVRDIQTIQKLGDNYNVYAEGIRNANKGFEEGVFLSAAYAQIQETVASKLTILQNQWNNFLANAGDASFPGIKILLDVIGKVIDQLNSFARNPFGKVVLTMTTVALGLVAAIAAINAIVAISKATMMAYATAMEMGVLATKAETAAMAELGTVAQATTVKVNATSIAFRALSVAGKATLWIAAIYVGIEAISALGDAFEKATNSSAYFARKAEESLGGFAGMQDALTSDYSAALAVYGDETKVAAAIASGELDGMTASIESNTEAAKEAKNIAEGYGIMLGSTVAGNIDTATNAIEKQNIILGDNYESWLRNQILQSGAFKDIANNQKAVNALKTLGYSFNDLFKASKNGEKGINDYFVSLMNKAGASGDEKLLNAAIDLNTAINDVGFNGEGAFQKLSTAILGARSEAFLMGNGVVKLDNQITNLGRAPERFIEQTKTLAKARTIWDYISEVQTKLKTAFEWRYTARNAADTLHTAWKKVADDFKEATKRLNELKASMSSLATDRSILEYQLGVAIKYGDTLRANQIQAELNDNTNKAIALQEDISKATQDSSRALTGNSDAAIKNRQTMQSLVTSSLDYLVALKTTTKDTKTLIATAGTMKTDFINQATAMGFSGKELTKYTASFDDFIKIIQNTSDKLDLPMKVYLGFDGADAALHKWKQENKGLVNAATYKRRTAKLNRMPLWADKNKIKELYKLAQIKTKETGFSWHVDHIIPLQGELVSGLHVFNNLQVISGIDNIKKHNKYEVL